jgi:tetratricopeptide (TPR) repeat protein
MQPGGSQRKQWTHVPSGIAAAEITAQTSRILASPAFQKSKRLSRFLTFAVDNALAGTEGALKESVLGVEVFDRGTDFDPRFDPIVRIDARRLRARLGEYYQGAGAHDPILIEFEPGSYVPRFREAGAPATEASAPSLRAPKAIRKVLTLDLLRRARHELEDLPNVDGILKALNLFERAALTNPENVLAHLGIALASIWMPVLGCESSHASLERAQTAAERAIGLDPTVAGAHTILGMVQAVYHHDFRAANASLLLAARLKPDFYHSQQTRAAICLAPIGRLAEAADTIASILKKDPRPRFHFSLGWIRYLQREWDAAIEEMEIALQANPRFIPAAAFRVRAHERAGRYDTAAALLRNDELCAAYPLVADRSAALALIRSGRHGEALALARRMETLYTAGSTEPLQLAEVFAALGDRDAAFEWLNRAYEDRRYWLIYLKTDPAFDALRDDPRFGDLVARLGLPAD